MKNENTTETTSNWVIDEIIQTADGEQIHAHCPFCGQGCYGYIGNYCKRCGAHLIVNNSSKH